MSLKESGATLKEVEEAVKKELLKLMEETANVDVPELAMRSVSVLWVTLFTGIFPMSFALFNCRSVPKAVLLAPGGALRSRALIWAPVEAGMTLRMMPTTSLESY